jgi:hypothetical protein
MTIQEEYLVSIKKQFRTYKALGDKSFDQLREEEINKAPNKVSNSIAIIVKHLHGNMLSRWTDFLTSDGEKENRNREQEFEGDLKGKIEMKELWEKGWFCLFTTLDALTPADLQRIIYIRKEAHTVMEAINRQLTHYPYHIGQIVYLARMFRGEEWTSLSIPKGKSEEFNKKMSGEKK